MRRGIIREPVVGNRGLSRYEEFYPRAQSDPTEDGAYHHDEVMTGFR